MDTLSLQQKIALYDDQHAFRQLFQQYYEGLLQFAASIVKVKEVAEDMVEDVFVKLWNNRSAINSIRNIRVYLYVALKNHCINYINRNTSSVDIDLDNLDVVCGELVPNPEDLMVVSEMLQMVNRAIHELPPKCRIVYKLVKEDGLLYKEVADILNISPRTVENHIALAIKRIAEVLTVNFPSVAKPLLHTIK